MDLEFIRKWEVMDGNNCGFEEEISDFKLCVDLPGKLPSGKLT